MKIIFLLLYILFIVGCASSTLGTPSLKANSPELFQHCIHVHQRENSGLWNNGKGTFSFSELNIAEISDRASLPYYTVVIDMKDSYPDGPLGLCYVDKVTKEVIYIYYASSSGQIVETDLGIGMLKEQLQVIYESEVKQRSVIATEIYPILNGKLQLESGRISRTGAEEKKQLKGGQ